jgi:methionine biosynthesis protein MetW
LNSSAEFDFVKRVEKFSSIVEKYNDFIWQKKLKSANYAKLKDRWRSRWDFAMKHVPSNTCVLDVGCGDGVLGHFLIKEKGCVVYGLDISKTALELARKRKLIVNLCDVSQDNFPFENETFDVVILACILEHVPFPEHTLQESERVLKRGGLMLITIPNSLNIKNRIQFLLGKMPQEMLHKDAGIHFRFWNYNYEFEKDILSYFKNLKVIKKTAMLKNPKKVHPVKRAILNVLIKIFPNLFGEYTNFLLKKVI